MIRLLALLLVSFQAFAQGTAPPEGIVWVASGRSFNQTWSRLQQAASQRGMIIHGPVRYDQHARGQLRPTASLALSNRGLDTRLLACSQGLATALPIRVAVWQAATGRVYLGYPDIHSLMEKYQLGKCGASLGKALSRNLEAVVKFAAH